MTPLKKTLAFLLALTVAGCTSEPKKATHTEASVKQNKIERPLNSKNQLEGLWISDTYLSKIEKSKSIYASQEYNTAMLGFQIKNDSLQGFNDYEGGFDAQLKYNAAKSKYEYDTKNLDTEFLALPEGFTVSLLQGNKLQLEFTSGKKDVYRQINSTIDVEINGILFEGSYTDKLTNTGIEFSKNGSVTGMQGKTEYRILYIYDEGYHYDTVFISDKSRDIMAKYQFKVTAEGIRLYNIDDHYKVGKLAYNLIKNK